MAISLWATLKAQIAFNISPIYMEVSPIYMKVSPIYMEVSLRQIPKP